MTIRRDFLVHDSLTKPYLRQKIALNRVLRILFTIAGCMWILSYVFPFGLEEKLTNFRLHQYQLYLILLTLWGYNTKRDYSRLAVLAHVSVEKNINVATVDSVMLAERDQLHVFDILSRNTKHSRWFPVLFTWLLLIASIAQIARQLITLLN